MSLLTKEQQEVLRQSRQRHEQWRGDCDAHTSEVLALADIIDDLQARAPKPLVNEQADKTMKDYAVRLLSRRQYTEQELMSEFEKLYPPFEGAAHEQIFKGWLMCARFLGALKAGP